MSNPLLTVPLPLVLDDESAWPQVIAAVCRAGAGRVALYSGMLPNPGNSIRQYRDRLGSAVDQDPALMGLAPNLRFYDLWAELLAQRIAGFAETGIPVVFWLGQSLGHGGGISGSTAGARPPFQPALTHLGEPAPGHFCPLCPRLRAYLSGALSRIARARPEAILLDDDFRLVNWTLPTMCACPLHQAEFRRRGLPDLPPAELIPRILAGGPERELWWSLQEDGLIGLGRELGEAVRAVAPGVRLGMCATFPTWEEVDLPRLLRAMAGPHRPLVRTACAPYWLQAPHDLAGMIEQVRVQRAWLAESVAEAEDLCEGDTFPHLTTRCSATLLHAYIQGCLAAGAPQILAYAFSYGSPLRFEPGYAGLLERSRSRYAAIAGLVPPGSEALGVTIPWRPGTARRLPMEPGALKLPANDPTPHAACARLGIPVAHGQADGPVLLIGRQAALATDAELEAWCDRGLVLDATAAGILLRRGLACGITSAIPEQAPNAERFLDDPLNGPYAGGAVLLWSNRATVYQRCEAAAGAVALSTFRDAADGAWGPAALRWEDARGRRFAILAWDWDAAMVELQLLWSHARRWQLQRLLGWVGRRPLPASLDAANAQLMVHRTGAGRIVASVLNAGLDPLTPVLRLDPALGRPASLRLLGPEGSTPTAVAAAWRDDGDAAALTLPCTLPALGCCLVELAAP